MTTSNYTLSVQDSKLLITCLKHYEQYIPMIYVTINKLMDNVISFS